ncbi:hypothetical protein P9281_05190 [Caballeronia sp. LP003]|uniref:hypothetical protein n=1 Tax=Caballeronia sp. LP003 TaxID=3038551 RepID=UPI002861A9B5|nr:hypothetical protein [Caballeronia sp. LP003]MDR5785947.1 hypothetical protein [Caballeronia sp. LP003]
MVRVIGCFRDAGAAGGIMLLVAAVSTCEDALTTPRTLDAIQLSPPRHTGFGFQRGSHKKRARKQRQKKFKKI